MTRKIIHVDMDAFYASVEELYNPLLKGKPVAVGGSPEDRGVVCTANYEARKYGVKSAMATKLALKLCPNMILIKPDFRKYSLISEKLISIYKEFTDKIEPLSLDECYLDVTENKKNVKTAVEIANILKQKIKTELHLTASVGVAPNKLLAKIASEMNKPDGLFVIKPHQVERFMKDLRIEKLWGVGKVTARKMIGMNIKTCSDLQKYLLVELVEMFGTFGETLYEFARGIDEREVVFSHEIKSIGSETTLSFDTDDLEFIKAKLLKEIEVVYRRIRKERLKVKTITLKAKYADFKQITRSKTLGYYTDNIKEITGISFNLINKTLIGRKKIRLIGVSLSNILEYDREHYQLDLLLDQH